MKYSRTGSSNDFEFPNFTTLKKSKDLEWERVVWHNNFSVQHFQNAVVIVILSYAIST